MNLGSIGHRSLDNMCYALNEEELVIQIRTGKDVERVFLHYEDPMESETFGQAWVWKGRPEEMTRVTELAHHKWWSITVRPPYKRCAYLFELRKGEETVWYLEDGFHTPEEFHAIKGRFQYFSFPWMNPADINTPPAWVKDTVWYQIFPERFCRGDDSLPKGELVPWGSGKVSNSLFYGGDLPGITSRIPYLADLGVTGLYLTPVFQASTTHKYDTIDYRKIDPAFGTEEDFRRLVDTAHRAGIRVMLDGVFNHCGYFFPRWQDVLKKGPESEYWNWFMINKWPFDQKDPWTYDRKYYSFHFTAFMPKLNTNRDEVIEYFVQTCEYWARNYHIDGFRLDVAHEVSHKFCKILRSRLKAVNPDFYILGEIWQDSMCWLRGDEYDSVMNYPFLNAVLHFFQNPSATNREFMYRINQCYTMYMEQTGLALFNLLDSHDTARLFTRLSEDPDTFFQALAVLYTMPGSPCIFYGTELAMPGGPDPDCRRCMPWEEIDQGIHDASIAEVKALIALRHAHPACRSPRVTFPAKDMEGMPARVVTYVREAEGERLLVRLNASDIPVSFPAGTLLHSRKAEGGVLLPGGYVVTKG